MGYEETDDCIERCKCGKDNWIGKLIKIVDSFIEVRE